jgi:hypothetical protein
MEPSMEPSIQPSSTYNQHNSHIDDNTSTSCQDDTDKFPIASVPWINEEKSCQWAEKKPWWRCTIPEVETKCPQTCKTCCTDNLESFAVIVEDELTNKTCQWVARKDTFWRCKTIVGIKNNCPLTCGLCKDMALSMPSLQPQLLATTSIPTKMPVTISPNSTPTYDPTKQPSKHPTKSPSRSPTKSPTKLPTENPTTIPSFTPSFAPSVTPSIVPTSTPSNEPSALPTSKNICSMREISGRTFYARFGVDCYKIDVFNQGKLTKASNVLSCSEESFNSADIQSEIDAIGKETVYWKKGSYSLEGYMQFIGFSSGLEEVTMKQISLDNQEFTLEVLIQGCNAPSLMPSSMPSSVHIALP